MSSALEQHSDPQIESKDKKYILITCGDSYVGQTAAMYITDQLDRREGQLKKKHYRVKVLCANKHHLSHLEKRGIEVKEVQYDSIHMLRNEMKHHIKTMIFIPPVTSDRVMEYGKNIIDCAVTEKVKRVIMVSAMGVECFQDKETPIGQLRHLEDYTRQQYRYSYYIIFRLPFIQQFMYFWTRMMESRGMVGMPIDHSTYLTTVNIKDVCSCLAQASLSKKSMVWSTQRPLDSSDTTARAEEYNDEGPDNNNPSTRMRRIYELRSNQQMNFNMIAEALNFALREAGSNLKAEPVVVSEDQLEQYLMSIAKKEGSGVLDSLDAIFPINMINKVKQKHVEVGAGINQVLLDAKNIFHSTQQGSQALSGDFQDNPEFYPRPSMVLTHAYIKLILNHFRSARNMKPPIAPCNDVRNITGREPIPLTDFFMSNRQQFRPEEKAEQ
ncbi:hypothetical protein BDF20DRAFT_948594 [Mycotypha africana]|uniref:uncharacterized protein n=1 Tax=Mycotypha africana TaxID=64632 RepID=UPI002301A803|nr:uncharacterized protein BDF20DRAFT_948594 [Mycotypha africana]KAI8971961.1 hypothetical protein BDF20DRAFT_948594 [Mycotypha africana]